MNLEKRPWKRTYFDEVEVVYENFVDPGPMQAIFNYTSFFDIN